MNVGPDTPRRGSPCAIAVAPTGVLKESKYSAQAELLRGRDRNESDWKTRGRGEALSLGVLFTLSSARAKREKFSSLGKKELAHFHS